jgi:uncharacterized C2H2 Zn-finger protein
MNKEGILMKKCPICGNWFRNNQGLQIHIGKLHKHE